MTEMNLNQAMQELLRDLPGAMVDTLASASNGAYVETVSAELDFERYSAALMLLQSLSRRHKAAHDASGGAFVPDLIVTEHKDMKLLEAIMDDWGRSYAADLSKAIKEYAMGSRALSIEELQRSIDGWVRAAELRNGLHVQHMRWHETNDRPDESRNPFDPVGQNHIHIDFGNLDNED